MPAGFFLAWEYVSFSYSISQVEDATGAYTALLVIASLAGEVRDGRRCCNGWSVTRYDIGGVGF